MKICQLGRFILSRLALVIFLLFGACKDKPTAAPELAGQIDHSAATEISGLAASHRARDLLWTHNDSGGQPVLYALATNGHLRGTVRLIGVKNIDWEDIASFELDGQPWLLIADTGDNTGNRKNCSLLVIAEPDPAKLSPAQELTANIAWRIPVVYPDSAHDCEAVAVDAHEEVVFLITKRTQPPTLYSLPLRVPADGKTPTAELVALLTGIPQPNSRQKILPTPTGRYRAQVTGLDIASDRTAAAVLTYGDVLFYPRSPGEHWATVFSRPPEILAPHGLPQAEAICFSQDNRQLYVTSELKTPRLLRYQLPVRAKE